MADLDLPPQPKAILRGHKTQVHAASFVRSNERLVTGDADGFVVAWDLTIMRPRAVWRAHENAILGISGWGSDKLITHGRDNKLVVWKLSADDEAVMSTCLPLDPGVGTRTKPWMLHMLEVNTMNFCAFASSPAYSPSSAAGHSDDSEASLLIAVPNTLASEAVDIYSLPSQARIHTVKLGSDNGMAMALALKWIEDLLTLLIGYENGVVVVARLGEDGSWDVVYRNHDHKQPVLSLDVAPSLEFFFTSGADATVAKHPLPSKKSEIKSTGHDIENVEHEAKVPEERASGSNEADSTRSHGKSVSLLSAALAQQPSTNVPRAARREHIKTQALKVVDTKHAGQQGLKVRSDGRIFATAGWDSKVRVYSVKSMREVAVLKWHPVGCFAVGFADVTVIDSTDATSSQRGAYDKLPVSDTKVVHRVLDLSVKDRRLQQAKYAHWLAAGSKDGKVSLWDVF